MVCEEIQELNVEEPRNIISWVNVEEGLIIESFRVSERLEIPLDGNSAHIA